MLTSSRCTLTVRKVRAAVQIRGRQEVQSAGLPARELIARVGSKQSNRQATFLGADARTNRFIRCFPAGVRCQNIFGLSRPEVVAAEMPAASQSGAELLEEEAQCDGEALVGIDPSCAQDARLGEKYCNGNSGSESGLYSEKGGGANGYVANEEECVTAVGCSNMVRGPSLNAQEPAVTEGAVAGGASVKRPFCRQCQKPAVVCICASMPKGKVLNKTKLVVLQHYKEQKHPLGSVRFAKLGFENVSVVVVKELSTGLPWMRPPFSRKERARARALARAQARAAADPDALQSASEQPVQSDTSSSGGAIAVTSAPATTPTLAGELPESASKPARVSSVLAEAVAPPDVVSTQSVQVSSGEGCDQAAGVASDEGGVPTETAASDGARGKSANGAATAAALDQPQEVRWERDRSGRKVRYPTFAPPPGIELTPTTAVLFPGPKSFDLLEAADFWGLAVHSSPFSPAALSLGDGVSATGRGCGVPNGSPDSGGDTAEQLGAATQSTARKDFDTIAEEVAEQLGAASLGTAEKSIPSTETDACADSHVGNGALDWPPSSEEPSTIPPAAGDLQNGVAFPAKPPDQLILIDGTWSKATRVFHEHGWLHALPQYKLPLGKRTSRYRNLRKEPKKEYLSTLESGAWALQLLEPALVEDIEGVLDSFGEMIKRQAAYQEEAVRQGRCWRVADP